MKVCEIFFDDGTREVECDDALVSDGILTLVINGDIGQMWNMAKITGIILTDKTVELYDQAL
jgi:hypothetical protein